MTDKGPNIDEMIIDDEVFIDCKNAKITWKPREIDLIETVRRWGMTKKYLQFLNDASTTSNIITGESTVELPIEISDWHLLWALFIDPSYAEWDPLNELYEETLDSIDK